MSRIDDVVRGAFEAWAEIEGFDVSGQKWPGSDLYHELKSIGDAQHTENDDGLTAFMVLWDTVRRYAGKATISPLNLYLGQREALATAEPYRHLLRLLDDAEILARVDEFRQAVRDAADAVGLGDVIAPLLDEAGEFAAVRRDALTSYRYLSVHSFRRGRRAPKLAFNRRILKFWNINSALRAAELQPWDGVSCCLIRDPVELWSFFALIVKDGENLTVWTDADRPTHPLQKQMSRSRAQERRFQERAFRLRFPYQLLDFKFDDEGRFLGEITGNAIVRINTEGVAVCEIEALEPDQALWLLMMFNLIRDRPRHRDEMSLTGEGLVALPSATATGALVKPVGAAELAPLVAADLSAGALVAADVFARASTGQNEWMAERYGTQVPEAALNLIGATGGPIRLLTTGEIATTGELELPAVSRVELPVHVPGRVIGPPVQRPEQLTALDPASFGTPAEIESDRRWIARYNQVAYIGALARKEFDERSPEIWRWFQERVEANWPNLLAAVVAGSLRGEVQGKAQGDRFLDFDNGVPQEGELLTVKVGEKEPPWYVPHFVIGRLRRYRWEDRRYPHYRCWETHQAATVWARFEPWTPTSLAQIVGVAVDDLPDVMRYWFRVERYQGNPILDRLDPLDWAIDNPWRTLEFSIVVGLSLSTYKRLCRDLLKGDS